MPLYLVCDVSAGMAKEMAALNEGLKAFIHSIVENPLLCDVVRLGILAFSDTAKVERSLSEPSGLTPPVLSAKRSRNYGAAFRKLAAQVHDDIRALKSQQYTVYRPWAFFLTCGWPHDPDWDETFTDTLTYVPATGEGMKWHPVFVPVSIGHAPEAVLRSLAYPPEKSRLFSFADTDDALRCLLHTFLDMVSN